MNHPLTRIFTPIAMIVFIAAIVVSTAVIDADLSPPAGETAVAALSSEAANSDR